MCDTTLEEFCHGQESDHYFQLSTNVVRLLGYLNHDMTLAMDHNVLSMVWELHDTLPEAIHLCAVLHQMYLRFCFKEKNDLTQHEFLSVLIHVVDRYPPKEGEESLQQMLGIASSEDGRSLSDDAKALWFETENIIREQKALIDSLNIDQLEKDMMHLTPPPAS
jgi:hypothetical protein